tara:strand:- start:4374 stop:4994 length:621 start_codon:yes stop_codon:yes gene_type:complete
MRVDGIWNQFSERQFDYLENIISNSSAKSICDIGAFAGSVSRCVWKAIKNSDKELYMLDNYEFLPEKLREPFFKTVKKTISDSNKVHTILEDSHKYNWTQHDFVIFSHADYTHFKPDFDRLIKSKVKWVALDVPMGCFKRTTTMLDAIKNKNLTPQYYVDGMIICGKPTPCTLPTEDGELLGHKVQWVQKKKGSYVKALEKIAKTF